MGRVPESTEGTARPDTDRAVRRALEPYVSRLHVDWLSSTPEQSYRSVDGTLLFADISGFTKLTERLARMGDVGAEEMSDALNSTFGQLLSVAAEEGADLLKWGGDAVLLLFDGPHHAARACRAAYRMRDRLRTVGRLQTGAGRATLRMSQGIHSGRVDLFLVGDPRLHRELLVCGPAVTEVVELEGLASAGEVAVGWDTGALVDQACLGAVIGERGQLLRREPELPRMPALPRQIVPVDLTGVLPVAIRQHLLRGVGYPEHRTVAAGFVAWAGSDDLLAAEGPEATAAALDDCVRNVSHAVADHDVTFFESDINRNGGKIMLIAGAPTSGGHDAERMLRAARQIVDRAGALPLRLGVNIGHVFSGDFGPAFRRTYSVKGDAINLAARLVARAEDGQVLATKVVADRSRTRFITRELPPFTVKGKARPVVAVDIGPLEEGPGSTGVSSTPLVGRGRELKTLLEGLDRARRGHGGVAELVGEAGIGKSRLLAELVRRAHDLAVLSVTCDEYESSTPYHVVQLLLRELLGVGADTSPEDLLERLVSRVRDNAPELVPWLPLLGTPFHVALPDSEETARLGDEFRKRRLHEVAAEFLHHVLPTATLFCFDDAHFMDAASADLLSHLAGRLPGEPWLVLLCRRDVGDGHVIDGDRQTLDLHPLSEEESVQLVRSATEAQPLPPSSVAVLATRAGGNPLFLESLVQAAGPTGNLENLPTSVQDLVTTRVDRLSHADRLVLRYASVLGMGFDVAELTELVSDPEAAADDETWQRLGEFVVAEEPTRLRFRHALMREVAYAGLPFRVRRQLHDRVGRALEEAGVQDNQELLSLHFFNAGRYDKAWTYSTRAARLARAKFANQEAVGLFGRAVEAERRGPKGAVDPTELGTLLEELGDTWFTIGLAAKAAEAYGRAHRILAGDPVHTGRVVAKQARVDQLLRKLPQSLRRVTRALRELDGSAGGPASAAKSQLAMRYAISRLSQGRVEEALHWGDRSVADAQEAFDPAVLAQAYANAHGLYAIAALEPPLPYGELALRAYTELGDLPHQADCTNNLAVSAVAHNRWLEGVAQLEAAAESYRRIGYTEAEGNANFNRAEVLVRQGHLTEAAALLEEAMRAARAASDDELLALVLRETGRVACRQGETERGLRLLAEAGERFRELDEPDELLASEVAIAEGLLLGGDRDGCLRACRTLLGQAVDEDAALQPDIRRIRGRAFLALGEPESAAREFEAGAAGAQEQDDHYARGLNLLGLSRALPEGDPQSAVYADEAAALLAALGVVAVPLDDAAPLTGSGSAGPR